MVGGCPHFRKSVTCSPATCHHHYLNLPSPFPLYHFSPYSYRQHSRLHQRFQLQASSAMTFLLFVLFIIIVAGALFTFHLLVRPIECLVSTVYFLWPLPTHLFFMMTYTFAFTLLIQNMMSLMILHSDQISLSHPFSIPRRCVPLLTSLCSQQRHIHNACRPII